jgi:hypothetical protein
MIAWQHHYFQVVCFSYMDRNSSGRAVKGLGLQPLYYWDHGFESR